MKGVRRPADPAAAGPAVRHQRAGRRGAGQAVPPGDFAGSAVRAFLAGLESPGTLTVAVIEDAHWAGEATIDLLSFLGRRPSRKSAILLVSYRSDRYPGGQAAAVGGPGGPGPAGGRMPGPRDLVAQGTCERFPARAGPDGGGGRDRAAPEGRAAQPPAGGAGRPGDADPAVLAHHAEGRRMSGPSRGTPRRWPGARPRWERTGRRRHSTKPRRRRAGARARRTAAGPGAGQPRPERDRARPGGQRPGRPGPDRAGAAGCVERGPAGGGRPGVLQPPGGLHPPAPARGGGPCYAEGMACCQDRELGVFGMCLLGWRAETLLLGQWGEGRALLAEACPAGRSPGGCSSPRGGPDGHRDPRLRVTGGPA